MNKLEAVEVKIDEFQDLLDEHGETLSGAMREKIMEALDELEEILDKMRRE